MTNLDFEEVVISGYGIREGILASFIQNSNTLENHKVENLENQNLKVLSYHCNKHDISPFGLDDMMQDMINYGLLKEREVEILSYALYTLSRLPGTNKHYSLFYRLLDEDYPSLTYREQVILAISIVYSKKMRTAEELVYKYSHLLKPQNLKSIQKIAILLNLATIIIKTGSQIRIRLTENQKMIITIISIQKLFPTTLLKQVIEKASTVFEIPIQYDIRNRIIRVNDSTNKIISIKSQT